MDFTSFALEKWYFEFEFSSSYNLSASGIKPFSLKELGWENLISDINIAYSIGNGDLKLREIIAEKYLTTPENILITNGAIEAIFLSQMIIINPGDKIIVAKPAYPALYNIAKDFGAKIINWELPLLDNETYDWKELEKIIIQNSPKALVINFPNNPTGRKLSLEEQIIISNIVEKYNLKLISDEIYSLLDNENNLKSFYNLNPKQAISIHSLSKAYGLPGLRIGWMIANKNIINKCINLRHYISLCSSKISEKIAIQAITEEHEIRKKVLKHKENNWKILNNFLKKWKKDFNFSFFTPQAGLMVFVNTNIKDNEKLCREFEKKESVLLLPGNKYGSKYSSFIRMGFGISTKELEYCLKTMDNFLKNYL